MLIFNRDTPYGELLLCVSDLQAAMVASVKSLFICQLVAGVSNRYIETI